MGTNCAPLEADLFLFCYERNFVSSLSDDIIETFNSTSRYLSISNCLVSPKFMIKAMTLILKLLIFLFWMAMFHVVPLLECIFLNF